MLSPLQLEAVRLKSLHFEAPDVFDSEADGCELQTVLDFDLSRNTQRLAFRVPVRFEAVAKSTEKGVPSPFARISATIEGDFSVAEGTPEEDWQKVVPANCVAMLYSLLRGVVLSATGSAEHGPVLIPVLNVHELVKQKAAAMLASTASQKGQPEKRPRKRAKEKA